MRLWTLHPCYLDAVALRAAMDDAWQAWRLLQRQAHAVGYPSILARWRACSAPRQNLSWFMTVLAREMFRRDMSPGSWPNVDGAPVIMTVTAGQVAVERAVLLGMMRTRGEPDPWMELAGTAEPILQPMFKVVPGGPESWETASEAESFWKAGRRAHEAHRGSDGERGRGNVGGHQRG